MVPGSTVVVPDGPHTLVENDADQRAPARRRAPTTGTNVDPPGAATGSDWTAAVAAVNTSVTVHRARGGCPGYGQLPEVGVIDIDPRSKIHVLTIPPCLAGGSRRGLREVLGQRVLGEPTASAACASAQAASLCRHLGGFWCSAP